MSADVPRPPRKGQDPPAARHLRLVSDKPTPLKKRQRKPPYFTPEEAARIRASLRNARTLFGSWACLADAMYLSRGKVQETGSGRYRPSPALVFRLARALGVSLESLYRATTAADVCPTCGARRAP